MEYITPRPYPSIQVENSKKGALWYIDRKKLSKCSVVEIDVGDIFQRHYIQLLTGYLDKQYFHRFPVNSHWNSGSDLGRMKEIPADCRVYQSKNDKGVAIFQIEVQRGRINKS